MTEIDSLESLRSIFDDYNAVRAAVASSRQIEESAAGRIASYRAAAFRDALLASDGPIGCYYWDIDDAVEVRLVNRGICPRRITDIRAALLSGSHSQPWLDHISEAELSGPICVPYIIDFEKRNTWQDELLSTGNLRIPSPYGSGMAQFGSSFVTSGVYGATILELTDDEGNVFFVTAEGHARQIGNIYLPDIDVIISFSDRTLEGEPDIVEARLAKDRCSIASLVIMRAARSYKAHNANLKDIRHRRGLVTLLIPNQDNFAHLLWNTLAGIERFILLDLIQYVHETAGDAILSLGDIRDLFPELKPKPIRDKKLGFSDCIFLGEGPHSKHVLIMPGSSFAPSRTRRRVLHVAQASILHDPAPIESRCGRPLIWIGIRANDRMWIDQERGVADYMNRLWSLYPSAEFLLEGFTTVSNAKGVKDISPVWQAVTEELERVAGEIILRSDRPNQVRSMIGWRLLDVIAIAPKVDLHVTPLGTAHHKVAWFSDVPGVLYAPESWSVMPLELIPGIWQADKQPRPTFLTGKIIHRQGISVRAPRTFAENFSLDVDNLFKISLELLSSRLLQ